MNKVDILDEAPKRLEATAATFAKVRDGLKAVIFGQDEVIEQSLVTLLAGGHGLLIGVPGLAKTKLVDTLGVVMGLDTSRVQFTPDLMPADITGSEVMEESVSGERAFRFLRGPVFTQLLMADEINRASPRTQSALLQAMQEKHVTVAGARHDLPRLFQQGPEACLRQPQQHVVVGADGSVGEGEDAEVTICQQDGVFGHPAQQALGQGNLAHRVGAVHGSPLGPHGESGLQIVCYQHPYHRPVAIAMLIGTERKAFSQRRTIGQARGASIQDEGPPRHSSAARGHARYELVEDVVAALFHNRRR